jgi:hypothetical protein
MDARHAMRVSDGSGTPYLVKAGSGLVLDGRQMRFVDPQHLGLRPNVVRVLYGTSQYATEWGQPGSGSARGSAGTCRLDASSLKALKGPPFTGFQPGQRAAIGIGYEEPDPRTGQIEFREFWAGWVMFN